MRLSSAPGGGAFCSLLLPPPFQELVETPFPDIFDASGRDTGAGIADRAVQHLGGRGVKRGEIVERLFREVRALRIYEGTSEVQKLILAKALMKG